MQHVEAVPLFADKAEAIGNFLGKSKDRPAIIAGKRALPDDQHRTLRLFERFGKRMFTFGQFFKGRRTGAQIVIMIGEIDLLPDQRDREWPGFPAFADTGIDQGSLMARIAADNQEGISLLNSGNGRVEEITTTAAPINSSTILTAIDIGRPQRRHQVFERHHAFRTGQIPGNGADFIAVQPIQLRGDGVKGFPPACRLQFPIATDIGCIEALRLQPIIGKAGTVRQPFLINFFIETRQKTHDFLTAGINADIRAHGIKCINTFGLAELPGAGGEGIGFGCQRTNGAKINNISGQFAIQSLLQIGGNFHIFAAVDRAQILHPGHFRCKPDAARTMDAAGHGRLDQRTHVLFRDGAFQLKITAGAGPVGHGLILQITFAALIADRAIQRMIDKKEFHRPFSAFLHLLAVSMDDHAIACRHRTGSDQLWRLFHLHQTHAAISGNGQALVIAETRNFRSRLFTGLKHRCARFDRNFYTIYCKCRHFTLPATSALGRPRSFP